MARIYTKRANKDYPEKGIKKGDTYFSWTTRPGGRGKGILHRSMTRPTRASMTSSEFLAFVYTIEDDRMPGLTGLSSEEAKAEVDSMAEEARDLASEQQDKLDNMPESLQEAPTGQMLQERRDALEAFADALESIDFPDEVDEPGDEPEEPEEPYREGFVGGEVGDEQYERAMQEHQKDHDDWEREHSDWEEATENFETFTSDLEAAIEEAMGTTIDAG